MEHSAPIPRPTGGRARTGAPAGFALLSPAFLEELRSRVTLSSLIGRTVPLRKAGNEFKACCPFHQEKTPSFWVNDQKAFYHCFGCGRHGDAISWLTDARGLAFIDAVRQLADETGLELPKRSAEDAARQERSARQHDLLDDAARYFHEALFRMEGGTARDYLRKRDIADATLLEFVIGYASPGRNEIARALGRYTVDQLVEAGLLIQVDGKEPYDRFRNRVMVPIRDARGRTIAFGGRILGVGEPKYLNSPDTPLFDKSRVLFNLDRAAPASRKAGRVLVVEGYFDAIALSQAGIKEVVAPMGTALTDAQLEQLWRLADEPILCFDGDSAGRKAAERACVRAMPALRPGKQLRIALLPGGQDPDDLIRTQGPAVFEQVLDQAAPLASFLYASERERTDASRPEQRANLRKTLEELARSCQDRLVADEFARSFRELFFEDFGWKKKQRDDVFKAAVRTSPRVSPGLSRSILRSTLYGLSRFPAVAAGQLEELSWFQVVHPDLERWRDAIGEAVILNPGLNEDAMREILEARLLPETLQRDIRYDLRFGFTRRATPADRAIRQLQAMVAFLAEERLLIDELREYDRRALMALETDADEFVVIEAARQRAREARAALLARGANWDGELQ